MASFYQLGGRVTTEVPSQFGDDCASKLSPTSMIICDTTLQLRKKQGLSIFREWVTKVLQIR